MKSVRIVPWIVILTCGLATARQLAANLARPEIYSSSADASSSASGAVKPDRGTPLPVSFARPVPYSFSDGVNSFVVGDVSGDGKPDLIAGGPNGVSVSLGNGDGTFQSPVTYPSGVGATVLADMNGDGNLDVVGFNGTSVTVLLGNGNGTFQAAAVTNIGGSALAVADINRDGIPDVVLTTSSGLSTMLGKGNGTFKAPVTTATTASGSLAVGDLNHDGIPDAVIVLTAGNGNRGQKQRIDGTIGVLFGNSNGTYQQPVVYDALGFSPGQIVITDFNLDGKPDIAVENALGRVNGTMGNVGILFNNGQGGFFEGSVIDPGGIGASAVAIGDIDGDGVPDVVVTVPGALAVVVVGSTSKRVVVDGPGEVVIADVNGDGQPDLLTTSGSNAVAVLLSKPLPTKTTVASSGSPSEAGQPVTFTATTISVARGTPPDGIIVTFLDGTKQLGTGTTINGVATFTTSTLKTGTNSIKAEFPGCIFFKSSKGTVKQVVNP
jgi:Bacterial Ig-like domain (group 3)/FG-GAP-like repeat